MKKELVLLFAVHLLYSTESYSVEQLYRSLNVTCFEEADLKRICDSQVYQVDVFSAINLIDFLLFRLSVLVRPLLKG